MAAGRLLRQLLLLALSTLPLSSGQVSPCTTAGPPEPTVKPDRNEALIIGGSVAAGVAAIAGIGVGVGVGLNHQNSKPGAAQISARGAGTPKISARGVGGGSAATANATAGSTSTTTTTMLEDLGSSAKSAENLWLWIGVALLVGGLLLLTAVLCYCMCAGGKKKTRKARVPAVVPVAEPEAAMEFEIQPLLPMLTPAVPRMVAAPVTTAYETIVAPPVTMYEQVSAPMYAASAFVAPQAAYAHAAPGYAPQAYAYAAPGYAMH